jgi:hypothetical protein
MSRTPRNYDGTRPTTQRFSDLLPKVLQRLSETYQDRPDLILASWPSLVGEKLAPMTEALSFIDGVLLVKVKNSTLYSLLNQNEKFRLLRALQQKFPKVAIKQINFRMS